MHKDKSGMVTFIIWAFIIGIIINYWRILLLAAIILLIIWYFIFYPEQKARKLKKKEDQAIQNSRTQRSTKIRNQNIAQKKKMADFKENTLNSKKTKLVVSEWKCSYCLSINPPDIYKCPNCSANKQ